MHWTCHEEIDLLFPFSSIVMTKKTTRWRIRRMRVQADKLGYKLSEALKTSHVVTDHEEPISPISMPDTDATNETLNSSSESMSSERLVSSMDVACALVLFKRRY
ncbi:unnamed protein product [Rotaria magnacalcarata]|uniref:Uncharacterized protein n=2 Tax=Rotaria magnacalcarata TaxID=392030 RepID=A0A816H2G3_9BILA|nr:unnamed protein product [Rotaria magnacalcarata]